MRYLGICKACSAAYELLVTPRPGHDYLPLADWLPMGDCPVCGYGGLDVEAPEEDA